MAEEITTEGTEGMMNCYFLCAPCGFPNPFRKIIKSPGNDQGIFDIGILKILLDCYHSHQVIFNQHNPGILLYGILPPLRPSFGMVK